MAARYRDAIYNSWHKNDPKDAAVILELLKQSKVLRYVDPLEAGVHDLQELSRTYMQISLARMRLYHSLLTHYLPLYWPEFEHKRVWLQGLYETAGETIGLPIELSSVAIRTFRLQLAHFRSLNRHRRELENLAEGCFGDDSDFLLLRRSPGSDPSSPSSFLPRPEICAASGIAVSS